MRGQIPLIELYRHAAHALDQLGFAKDDIEWSENAGPPDDADEFASEAIFVICNSGMKNTVARRIFEKVMPVLKRCGSAHSAFGHKGKAEAMNAIWDARRTWHDGYLRLTDDAARIEYLGRLPWIGGITKYHLAKNFGVDVAKPDVHLQRLAEGYGTTPQAMCETIGRAVGLKARTIDLILWRACAERVIDSRTCRLSEAFAA